MLNSVYKYNLKIGLNSERLYNIGQRIKNRRIELGLSQKQLAKCVSIDASNLSKFENGKLNISLLQYYDILETLQFFDDVEKHIKELRDKWKK